MFDSIESIPFSKHYFDMCLRFATNVNEITDSKMSNIQLCPCGSIVYYHLDLIVEKKLFKFIKQK